MNTTSTQTRPLILTEGAEVDPFATDATAVKASALRSGMVLLDPELGTPEAVIDHKMRTQRGSGDVRFLVQSLDSGRYSEVNIFGHATVNVLAKSAA
jgi:hypothetical protein